MVTRSHTQLKQDDITEDLSICDSSEPNLKNFCGKRRRKPQRTMLRGDTHMMSTFGGGASVLDVQCLFFMKENWILRRDLTSCWPKH